VGWYLMVPPLRSGQPTGASAVGPEAPLRFWQNMGSFDIEADCYKAAQATRLLFEAGNDVQGGSLSPELKAEFLTLNSNSKCIATDDPNLKTN
jgi:hypothetical protein